MQVERSRPLYEQAYAALRTAILEGRVAPGERLVETRLAEMLAISRTPIREAIRQLERDGLVIVTAHDGAYARKPDRTDLQNLYLCRSALERLAASEAAKKATERDLSAMEQALSRAETAMGERNVVGFLEATSLFHRQVDLATYNDRLDELLERARAPLLPYRALLIRALDQTALQGIHVEHLGILATLKSRDSALADRVMEQHMRSDLSRILSVITDFRL
ncbi:MAG: GntR family transcriptional regulator [Bacillota bacterium]